MNDTPTNTHSVRNIAQFSIALLLVIPAVLFWGGIIFIGVAIVGLSDEEATCNVARIPVQGILTTTDYGIGGLLDLGPITTADTVIDSIHNAEQDPDIVALLIDVDSPGGTPVAADEIMTTLVSVEKPVVSVVRDLGTSAAYWVAAGTDHIVASPVSDVGSIGVTMSYLEFAESEDNEGTRWIDLSSGIFKDAGNPNRTLREEEEAYFQSQVDDVHEYMLDRISSARSTLSREEFAELADGRAFIGSEALELGLIDRLGSFAEAGTYLAEVLNMSDEELVLCPPQGPALTDLFL